MVLIEHLFLVTEFGTQYLESAIIQIHSKFSKILWRKQIPKTFTIYKKYIKDLHFCNIIGKALFYLLKNLK